MVESVGLPLLMGEGMLEIIMDIEVVKVANEGEVVRMFEGSNCQIHQTKQTYWRMVLHVRILVKRSKDAGKC